MINPSPEQEVQALRDQATRTAALARSAGRLNARLDLAAVLQAVCQEASQGLEVPIATVSLYDEDVDALVYQAGVGLPADFGSQVEPLSRRVYEQYTGLRGNMVVVSDIASLENLPNAKLYRDLNIRTTASTSMIREGELIGRLNVATVGQVRQFSAEELAFLQGLADQAALAIANAQVVADRQRAQLALERQTAQLGSLIEMGQAVASTLDLETVLDRVLEQGVALVQAEGISVLLREADELVFAATNGPGTAGLLGQRAPLSAGIAGEVLRSGRPVLIQDAIGREHLFRQIESPTYQVRSLLVVPLRLAGSLIGVIEALHSQPAAFDVTEQQLLEAAANWTAIALGNARQHERLRSALEAQAGLGEQNDRLYRALSVEKRRLELLYELSQKVATTLNAQDVAANALDLVLREIGSSRGEVFLVNPERDGLEVIGLSGYQPEEALRLLYAQDEPIYDQGLAGAVKASRQVMIVPDVTQDPHWRPWPGAQVERGSAVGVPLMVGEYIVGVMTLFSQTGAFFNGEHQAMLRAISTPVALALQNARLFDAERHAHQIADTLRAANLDLAGTLAVDAILEHLLDHLGELVPYDSASVMILEGRSRLVLRAMRGYERWSEKGVEKGMAFEAGETSNLREIVASQKGLIIPDTRAYPGWLDLALSGYVRSWMGVPLIARNKVIGLFALDKAEPGFFTEAHLRLVEALAAQAAVAIQNARLFEELSTGRALQRRLAQQLVSAQEEERQRVSRELHDEAGQALTALKISLTLIQNDLPQEQTNTREQVQEAIGLASETMEQIRLIAHALRPPALDTVGLNATLEGFCRDFAARTRLTIEYQGRALPNVPPAITISCYRFLQEALTNVAKHSGADRVEVELSYDGDTLALRVEDNGKGIELSDRVTDTGVPRGIGLLGMWERFELLGGRLDIESAPGRGTRLVARVPWRETS
jgi:GAF domain-containing protein